MTGFRTILRRGLAVVCYYAGLDALFYRLNCRAKRIVTFHNVLPDEMCKSVPHIGVSQTVSSFERTVDELRRHYSFNTDVMDPSALTITFDDGVLNEYEVAGGLLRRRGIPAILFVAGDIIGADESRMLVTDQLLAWTKFVPEEIARREFGEFADRGELWIRHVAPAYRADFATRGKSFLAKLNSAYPMESVLANLPSEWRRLRMTGVTQWQLDDLRSRGWLIGWHTRSHFPLGVLPDDERQAELDSPAEYRKVVLGYPYGDVDAVGVETLKIAERLGYPAAVSNDPDRPSCRGRYFLQRMALSDNKYDLHMVLSGLKYFIKFRRLLPIV